MKTLRSGGELVARWWWLDDHQRGILSDREIPFPGCILSCGSDEYPPPTHGLPELAGGIG
ncbi:MAG: hypothetical protein R3F50_08515 [Gammaproteobacteria bacterium]